MFYKRPRRVFLFQAVVGIASFVSVLTMGRTGLALIAFLFFRPFIFRQDPGAPGDPVRLLYDRALKISVVATAACLAATYLAREAGLLGDIDGYALLLLILPASMIIHGVTGFVLSGAREGGHNGSDTSKGDK